MVHHFRRVGAIKDGKPDAVKTGDPKMRAKPKVSVARLKNGLDAVLRQTILGFPMRDTVLSVGIDDFDCL